MISVAGTPFANSPVTTLRNSPIGDSSESGGAVGGRLGGLGGPDGGPLGGLGGLG